jgi:ankyrin repeat protein
MVSFSQALTARGEKYNSATRIEEMDREGRTPLFCAVENEHLEVAKLLLEAGADIETKNRHGQTLMSMAGGRERAEIRKLLRDYGAAFKDGVDAA